jgi:hypothetical protein
MAKGDVMVETPTLTTPERTADVILGFARRGYARSLQAVHGHLWCPSCDADFDSHDLIVEETVATSPAPDGSQAVVYALRCTTCGTRGVWLVHHPVSEEDLRLLRWVDSLPSASGDGGRLAHHCQRFAGD